MAASRARAHLVGTASLERWALSRARLFICLLQFGMLALAGRCAYLQLHCRERYQALQDRYLYRTEREAAPRGSIWSRNGEALARNVPVWRVGLDPAIAAGTGERDPTRRQERVRAAVRYGLACFGLAQGASERESIALAQLAAGKRWVFLLETEDEARVRALGADLPATSAGAGIGRDAFAIELGWRREYPHADAALQLLGEARPVAAHDASGRPLAGGIFGLELDCEAWLAGGERAHCFETAGGLRPIRCREVEPIEARLPRASDIVVTLDLKLQLLLERLLEEALATTGARRVMGVVMDPRNGEILAAGSAPFLTRGEYGRRMLEDPKELERYTLPLDTFSYEPGSTLKPVILAEAIARGLDLGQLVTPGGKSWSLRPLGIGRTISDSGAGHDRPLSVEEALVYSSNIGMVKLGLILKEEGLRSALERFDLPRKRRWDAYTTTSIPMGYEIEVTPRQLLAAYAAIANGGRRVEPHAVRQVDGARRTERALPAEGARALDAHEAATLCALLRRAAVEGTGRRLDCGPVEMAGKTGTAKVSEGGVYVDGEYRSCFVGFAPWQDPRWLVYVLVDRPRGQYYGAEVAGPVARRLIGALMHEAENPLALRLRAAVGACDALLPATTMQPPPEGYGSADAPSPTLECPRARGEEGIGWEAAGRR